MVRIANFFPDLSGQVFSEACLTPVRKQVPVVSIRKAMKLIIRNRINAFGKSELGLSEDSVITIGIYPDLGRQQTADNPKRLTIHAARQSIRPIALESLGGAGRPT